MKSILAIGASMALAAGASAGVLTHTFDLSGLGASGGFFDEFPTIDHNFGVAGTITAIEFDLNLVANAPSWQSEAIVFVDGSADGLGEFESWISEDYGALNEPGAFSYSDAFPVDIDSPAGYVAVTLADSFSDDVEPNHVYGDGSFITVTFTPVPAPGALALLGLGGVAALRRRR